MKHLTSCIIAVALIMALCVGQSAAFMYEEGDTGGDGPVMNVPDRGWPGGDLFPNHDPAYIIVSLTNNDYRSYTSGDTPVFPHGYYFKYPCFNADGTRLACVTRTKFDGVGDPYEIWVCDYDGTTHTTSNPVKITSTGGTGDVVENKMCSWSRTDPDLLLFLEAHMTQANPLMTYDCGTSAFATLYDPALDTNGFDSTNPGFYALNDGAIVVGSGYNTGNDRILLFDGTYPSTTISSADKNLDPASSYDGTRVSYYSTNSAYAYPAGSIYTAYSGGVWTENTNGWGDPSTGDVPGLWAFYSGKSDDRILSLRSDLGWTSTALALYASDGTLLSDLTGDGGTDFQWIYANHGWEGPGGEILFRAEQVTHSGYGNNMFIALAPPSAVWVDDDWTGPGNCGGHSWGFDAFSTIQEGIDAVSGSTVNVAAGTYREQLKIDGKSLDLVGAGIGSTIVEAVDVGSRTTYSITQWTGSARTIDACVGVVGPGTVNISGLTVDGRELGPDNFYGIHFFDTSGSVTDCRIEDILYGASPSASRVASLVASHGVAVTAYTIDFSDNVIPNFQKGGVLLMGPYLTFTVDGNEITNVPSNVLAGNGIQLSYGATGTTSGNVVHGVGYTGEDWSATGILLFESGDISMSGDVVHACQTAVDYSNWGWIYPSPTVVNVSVSDLLLYDNGWSLSAQLSCNNADLTFAADGCVILDSTGDGIDLFGTDIDPWGGVYYTGWDNGDLVADITNCVITGATLDGLWVDDYSGNSTNTMDIEVHQTSFESNVNSGIWNSSSHTVDATYCWWGDPGGPTVLPPARDTRPAKAPVSPFGEELPERGEVRYTETGSSRARSGVYGPVAYNPWLGANIVCVPDPESLTATNPVKTIAVNYLGGGSGLMFGYTVKVRWDGSIVSTLPVKVTEGALLSGGASGTTFFYPRTTGTNEITVDCIQYAGNPGVSGPGTMFYVEFTGLALGTSDVVIIVDRVRDKDNNTLTGFVADYGLLVVDLTVPTVASVQITNDTLGHTNDYVKDGDHVTVTATVTDDDPTFDASNIVANLQGLGGGPAVNPTYVAPVATWVIASVSCTPADDEHLVTVTVTATDPIGNTANANDAITADNKAPTAVTVFDAAPGNGKCDLGWTNGTDTYYYGTVVRREEVASEYPQYPWFVSNWAGGVDSAYPTDEADGTGVYDGTGTSYTDGVAPRNIYYYQVFCYDWALNYGPADAGARDLATNYWLGDISDGFSSGWGYDGLVDDGDILMLSGVYGNLNPVTVPGDAECDVGPTVHPDWHRLGLPTPDNSVEFEDAMIFAMNYGVVTARVVPFLPEEYSTDVLALTLSEREMAGSELEVALRLEGNVGDVKGVSAAIAYDSSELEFMSVRLSDDMSSPLADVFFWSGTEEGLVLIDALVLGTDVTIGGSGDVAVLTFRVVGDGYSLEVESARIRNADNVELDAKLGDIESGGELPLVFRLVQNSPNPFNPVTKVAYHVPRASEVTIRVYDVSGRVVMTLVDGVVEAGRHVAVWNGRNDAGESVGSGIYFCTMEAPDFHDSRKMTLLK